MREVFLCKDSPAAALRGCEENGDAVAPRIKGNGAKLMHVSRWLACAGINREWTQYNKFYANKGDDTGDAGEAQALSVTCRSSRPALTSASCRVP